MNGSVNGERGERGDGQGFFLKPDRKEMKFLTLRFFKLFIGRTPNNELLFTLTRF